MISYSHSSLIFTAVPFSRSGFLYIWGGSNYAALIVMEEKRSRKIPGPKKEKNILECIEDMENAMKKVAEEQDLPTLQPVSTDKVMQMLRKRPFDHLQQK